jgi:hypothetical protein
MNETTELPEGLTAADAPTADPDHPMPDGAQFATNSDGELIALIPGKQGGWHFVRAGIGADPATLAARIAATMKTIGCMGL